MTSKNQIKIQIETNKDHGETMALALEKLFEGFNAKVSISKEGYLIIFTMTQSEFDRIVNECYKQESSYYFVRCSENQTYKPMASFGQFKYVR